MQQTIREELTSAMKARDELRLRVLRRVVASITNELIAKNRGPQGELSDDEVLSVIKKIVKQHKDSIEQFEKGNRTDLAETEKAEMAILEGYLPEQMGRDEIEKIAKAKKEELGITDKSKMGMFMGAVMKECAGKADGVLVKDVVEKMF